MNCNERVTFRVHYQIATYSGHEDVQADPNAERDFLVARVKQRLARVATLPFGAQSFRIERLS